MIIKLDEDVGDQPTTKTAATPASKPSDIDCIQRKPVNYNQPSHQSDDEDDSFSKGYN